MGHKSGTYGEINYSGNQLTIDIDPNNTLGGIALTSGQERVECYWDGNQWVCTSIGFAGASQSQAQAPGAD
jgi:hypothetical protein